MYPMYPRRNHNETFSIHPKPRRRQLRSSRQAEYDRSKICDHQYAVVNPPTRWYMAWLHERWMKNDLRHISFVLTYVLCGIPGGLLIMMLVGYLSARNVPAQQSTQTVRFVIVMLCTLTFVSKFVIMKFIRTSVRYYSQAYWDVQEVCQQRRQDYEEGE